MMPWSQRDHGVPLDVQVVEAVDELAEPVVGHGHLGGVQLPHAAEDAPLL
jgi:hypothetical protein